MSKLLKIAPWTALFVPFLAWAQVYPGQGNGYNRSWGMMQRSSSGAGIHIIGFILWVIFWVLVIWLIISFLRYIFGGNKSSYKCCDKSHDWKEYHHGMEMKENRRTDAAIELLRERYAKGEIERAEFLMRKEDLEKM